jgi:hypothetical protein
MTSRILLASALGLVLWAVSGASGTSSNGSASSQPSCPGSPVTVSDAGIATTPKVVSAVRRGVPRIFRDFTTQGGGPGWHHYQVLGLVSLNGGYYPAIKGIDRYRGEARRRCGRAVALSSWVIFLQFPEAPMVASSFAHMFVTKTRAGWVAW